jgi:voltage-gated potassium channel
MSRSTLAHPVVALLRSVASLTFAAGYSVLVLVRPHDGALRWLCLALVFASWSLQITLYVVQAARARGRSQFVRRHPLDLAAAVFPLLGIFTLLNSLRRLPGLRGESGNAVRSRIALRASGYVATFVYVIALTELAVERGAPHSTIHTFGEAIWWACVTITTIGYGDFAPVTPIGRLIAIVLMAGGLVIIGTASALIVSYITERAHLSVPVANTDVEDRQDPG